MLDPLLRVGNPLSVRTKIISILCLCLAVNEVIVIPPLWIIFQKETIMMKCYLVRGDITLTMMVTNKNISVLFSISLLTDIQSSENSLLITQEDLQSLWIWDPLTTKKTQVCMKSWSEVLSKYIKTHLTRVCVGLLWHNTIRRRAVGWRIFLNKQTPWVLAQVINVKKTPAAL